MHRFTRLALTALALVVVCAAAWGAAETAEPATQPAARALRIAVVDLSEIMRESEQWQDTTEERMRMMDRMRRTLTKMSEQLQVLRNEYENLPPDTEQRAEKQREMANALQELQRTRNEFETEIAEHHNQAAREMFTAVTEAVKAHAEQNDLDLVLKKQNLDLAGMEDVEQSLLLATTEVLYARPMLDISGAVVERINADYPGPIETK
ncbi:MAG: OmpH family outer membrane protein [Candidatus Brocadiia bacterium]